MFKTVRILEADLQPWIDLSVEIRTGSSTLEASRGKGYAAVKYPRDDVESD